MFLKNLFKNVFSVVMLAIVGVSMSVAIVSGTAPTNNGSVNTYAVGTATLKTADEQNGKNKTAFAGNNDLISAFCGKVTAGIAGVGEIAGCIAAVIAFVVLTIAVVYMVYGAFIWLTDTEKGAERGRKIIFNAVIAMVVAVLAFAISALITNVLAGSGAAA